jgi:20S proteasome alpha/beta subunit
MTVCIAAVCNFGPDKLPMVVCASDRMITINEIEYEPEQTKIIYLASQTVGLFAGDMQLHATVVPRVMQRISVEIAAKKTILVEQIAEIYAEEFGIYRRKRAAKLYLTPLNLTVDNFLQTEPREMAFDLANKMLNAEIDSGAIIAGIDTTGAHIFRIHDPGVATCFDTPFFAAIGIGENHASSQFMLAKFEKRWTLEKTLFLTYSAKTLAEAAAGVGKQTDMVIIRPGIPEPIYALTKDELEQLDRLLTTTSEKDEAARQEAYDTITKYMEEKRENATESKDSGHGRADAVK